MHKYIGFIAAAFAVLGALSIALMFYGHFNEGGMAVLAFQLWGLISIVSALVFALVSRFMAKYKSTLPHGASRFAIAVSIIILISLGLGMIFIG